MGAGFLAEASTSMSLGLAGFFGRISLGAVYEYETKHDFEISLGVYSGGTGDKYQNNFSYRYSPWKLIRGRHSWDPIQVGIFALYSWDKKFFLKSPGKYPGKRYYEQTAFRWGLEQGTTFHFCDGRYSFGLVTRIIDSGLVAIYNNMNRDLQYYLSSGLRFEYHF